MGEGMLAGRLLVRGLLALGLSLGVVACGGGDDSSGDGGATHGTCDLRSVGFSCIERSGTPAGIEDQKSGCLDAGGLWSNDPCPTEDLVGCCDYTFGDPYHECFYTGITRDPVAYCMMWDDGV